jgi:hypothetical protein
MAKGQERKMEAHMITRHGASQNIQRGMHVEGRVGHYDRDWHNRLAWSLANRLAVAAMREWKADF